MQSTGLREVKKSRTRQLIAQTAADLFRAHGYANVTVEAIAQAAQVSKKTVFNYFPTKEDLVFTKADDRRAALLASVTQRPAGVTVLESFRALCLAQTEGLVRMREAVRQGGGFFDLVEANPSLQRKAHEVNIGLVDALAEALAAEAGTSPADLVALITATTLVSAQRTLYRSLRVLAGSDLSDATVIRRHRHEANRVFDDLADGFGTYLRKP